MNPWPTYPAWQNYSYLFRECTTALEAKTGMEKSQHLTSALYFGIAALEAFLNEKMRSHLQTTTTEEEIVNILKKSRIISKLKNWPVKLVGKPLNLNQRILNQLTAFNEIRGHLTHPKTHGQEIEARLAKIDPISVIDCVAEYIVRFHETAGTRFPYWLFGWNYLNPRSDSYDILIINDQQFCFSLQTLGFRVPAASYGEGEVWRDQYLGTFEGYTAVRNSLSSLYHCEPKFVRFPFKPILCRRWWTVEHQGTCGHVTDQAVANARRM